MKGPEFRINDQIRARQVRVVDDQGGQLGVMAADLARKLARERGLDLVEVAPAADPPVCRVLDYGKFKYEQRKRDKQTKRTIAVLKELRLRPLTGVHDLETKVKNGRKFLEEGAKVQFTVVFRGREMAHKEIGLAQMNHIKAALADVAKVDRDLVMLGNRMSIVVAPKAKGEAHAKAKDAQRGGQAAQADRPGQAAVPAGGTAAPALDEKREAPPPPPQVGPVG